MDDPKRRLGKSEVTDDDLMAGDDIAAKFAALQAQVTALVQQSVSSGGLSEEKLERILLRVSQMSADAAERAANPSNKTHPGISVYSYPEGDRARPRPAFKCKMIWGGAECFHETTTAEEIALLNQAEAGVYSFRRSDGSLDTLTVDGTKGPDGRYSQLVFSFLTKERRETLPGMVSMLQQALAIKTKEQMELDALRAQIEALKQRATVAA